MIMKHETKDLIPLDVSRCANFKCEKATSCKRHLQLYIDKSNDVKHAPVTVFEWDENGYCDWFF
jgi:hypothetical protein